MSYPRDLDEIPEDALTIELYQRLMRRLEGRCDYCARVSTTKTCKFSDRHRDPRIVRPVRRRTK